MTFKGFNVKYPEYEVITPQTKQSFTLRNLNVQEEERMKGSMMTPIKVTEHLNTCIYDAIVKKPDKITDFTSFLKNVTLKDREALLYGLYSATYEDIRNYQVKCISCKSEYPVTIKASDTFNFTMYPDDDILTKTITLDLPKTSGVSVFIRQPTLFEEMKVIKNMSSRPGSTMDLIIETLTISKFVDNNNPNSDENVYEDRADIMDAYLTLSPIDKRFISDKYYEEFGKYSIELKMKSYCPKCSTEDLIDIDLVENFFRELYSV